MVREGEDYILVSMKRLPLSQPFLFLKIEELSNLLSGKEKLDHEERSNSLVLFHFYKRGGWNSLIIIYYIAANITSQGTREGQSHSLLLTRPRPC